MPPHSDCAKLTAVICGGGIPNMDKPNKTDNAEQPAETVDTEGGLTAEKPRGRRKKTSIAHIATVCGSVYTGGKTAKDIKKQAEQSAITADDDEIIEIPEPVELYETDCLREPEDSEDASPYDPLSAVCLNGRRSVEELMETGNLSDIDRLRGIVVCEERPLNKKREYANRLTELLGGTLHMLPPVRSGNDVWKMLFDEIPSVFVVSVSLPDIDAFALINTLRQSKLCRNARFFVCAPKMTKSLIGISRNEKIDGLLSFSAPVEQTAAAIIEKCLDYEKKRGKSDLEALEQAINNPAFFSEMDEQKRQYAMVTDSILLPLGLQNEHRGTEFLRLLVCMRIFGVDADLKRMYEYVAMYYHSTPAAVERAIRYSIECAWEGGNLYMQFELFGNTTDSAKGKPTNAEFIATVVQHIRNRLRHGSAAPKAFPVYEHDEQ